MRKLVLVCLLLIVAILGGPCAFALEDANSTFDLDRYINLYLQNSPEVVNAFNDLAKAELNFKNNFIKLFLPSANFNASTVLTSKENHGFHLDNPYDASLNLNWNLFNSGKDYLSYLQHKNTLKLAHINFENKLQDIVLNAIQTFYDLRLKESLLTVADNDLKSKKDQLETTRQLYKAGLNNYTYFLQGENNYKSAQLSAKQKQANYEKSKMTFNTAIGRAPEAEAILKDNLTKLAPLYTTSYDEDLSLALLNRQDINQKILTLQNDKISKKITTLQNMPALQAGFSLNNNSQDISGTRSNHTNYSLGLSLNVPIGFVGVDNYYNIQISKLDLVNSYMGFEDTLRSIRQKVLNIRTELALQFESIKISEGNLKIAKERLEITTKKYNVGQADALDLADAQNTYLSAQINDTTYRYDYQLNQYSYKRTLGLPIYDLSTFSIGNNFADSKIKQIDTQFLNKE